MRTNAEKTSNKTISLKSNTSKNNTRPTFQFRDNRSEHTAQLKLQTLANQATQQDQPVQKKENKTGLPDNLKSGIENLSGHAMDDVKVHYNSSKPAQLQAHAYAQGTDIHIGPSQEKHLPHEAWHVVQQKQGRVKPTMQMKDKVNVNDDTSLEREADIMGTLALQKKTSRETPLQKKAFSNTTVQRNIDGLPNIDNWLKAHNIPKIKGEKIKDFLEIPFEDAKLDFTKAEVDAFYNTNLKNEAHANLGSSFEMYHEFKRFIAAERDDEGAHGAERHGGSGDKFIVDRVNESPRNNFTASYLKMDSYLEWDTILNKNAKPIHDAYKDLAEDSIYSIEGGNNPTPYANVLAITQNIRSVGGCDHEKWVKFTEGGMTGAMLKTEIRGNGVSAAEGDDEYEIKVAASIEGGKNIASRSVSKVGGSNAVSGDVVDLPKKPVAHTGGLAPEFEIDNEVNITKKPAGNKLNWVTKF